LPADPAILERIRGCPFARGGRVLVRFRADGYSLFARRSGVPLARLRLTGEGDEVVLLYPSHRRGWEPPGDFGAVAMPLDLALEHLRGRLRSQGAGSRFRFGWARRCSMSRIMASLTMVSETSGSSSYSLASRRQRPSQ